MRAALCFAIALCAPAFGGGQALSSNFDPSPWRKDFHQLLGEISSHYANLEWAVNDRRMDLPKLRAETEASLAQAKDETSARRVLEHFVDAFGDGHLEIDWPNANANPTQEGTSLCHRLGYTHRRKPGIDFAQLPGFTPVHGDEESLFAGGLLSLSSGKKLGVIRISELGERAFPEVCE